MRVVVDLILVITNHLENPGTDLKSHLIPWMDRTGDATLLPIGIRIIEADNRIILGNSFTMLGQ